MSEFDILQFRKLTDDAIVPTRGTPYAAGWDLYALEDTIISPMSRQSSIVRTGIAVQLPPGTYGRIALRSGISFREGAVATAGVIDEDYVDEVKVLVIPKVHHYDNTTIWKQLATETGKDVSEIANIPPGIIQYGFGNAYMDLRGFRIQKGERFAQLVIEKIYTGGADVVTDFRRQYNGHLGFGSTGNTLL